MNILPTFRSERAKRVGRIIQAWAITLSMTLGSFTAAWVARDLHGSTLLREQAVGYEARLAEDRTAKDRIISELTSRVSEQAQVITTLSLTVEKLAKTTQDTADNVNKAATATRRAATTSQQAAKKATQAVQEARSPITEDSRRNINEAINKANQQIKR